MRLKKRIVQVNNLHLSYHTLDGETKALSDLSFHVSKGEIITIVGPSGCGKSTLLSIISGLLKPSSGKVTIEGIEVTDTRKDVGYMFQNDLLFEWRNILDNVLIGLEVQKKLTSHSKEMVEKLLSTYGLKDFKNHYPNQLSGGMRQRVALIRTLAIEPKSLLLDEPFSALDYQTRLIVADDIYNILKKEKKAAIMITHDISAAMYTYKQTILLHKKIQGHIIIYFP
ncbi:ABC transporter ATP-binding protein [Anaeromicrobium sediminis]|uniref:ABC transporter n=1 Tax=Anaeromicrobium sediminis TaxID=1478221 RepID=A0A267MAA4_9FIRM|nr:ABC transporter ATP-binding protein [Anaeromicrobium sediminis]PAB56499.1 ABC transporter [Anaeromicrobium sediminis]